MRSKGFSRWSTRDGEGVSDAVEALVSVARLRSEEPPAGAGPQPARRPPDPVPVPVRVLAFAVAAEPRQRTCRVTFYLLAALIVSVVYAFAFWRGRRFERARQSQRRGGLITPRPAPTDWNFPSAPPATPLNDRLGGRE